MKRPHLVAAVMIVLFGSTLLAGQGATQPPAKDAPAKVTEELVHARSDDAVINGGLLFVPAKPAAGAVAVIWVHGWGQNFYYPSYVKIGRALAGRGHPCVTVNTRKHDIGTAMAYRGGKRIRGGGYWGVPKDEVRDLAAWVDFAAARGFTQVILVGHSAGWAAVRAYQSQKQDPRVVGVVVASGGVRPPDDPPDADVAAQAKRLVAEGKGDDLIRLPRRSFPSFVSAATYLDFVQAPAEQLDFFGVKTANPAVTRVRCPLLAWFGTGEPEIGTPADLELIKTCIARQPTGPRRVDTVLLQGADHMYHGEEAQVAQTLAKWAASLGTGEGQDRR